MESFQRLRRIAGQRKVGVDESGTRRHKNKLALSVLA